MRMTRQTLALVLASGLAGTWLAACGGASAPVQPTTTPFMAAHEAVYENGVDMVRDPEGLGGAWLHSWEDELDQRVSHADIVALVTIRTFRTDIDLDRRETYRLIAHPERVYFGELTDDIQLTVAEGEAGYGTVGNNQRQILDQQFIAFIKWEERENADPRARWHLSMASDQIATRVRSLLSRRRDVTVTEDGGARGRVIVHEN